MVILIYSVSFSYIASLTAYPTLPGGGTPNFFFRQNDRKGCSLDYLNGFSHFLFGFGAAGKNYPPPPLGKRRVKCSRVINNKHRKLLRMDANLNK